MVKNSEAWRAVVHVIAEWTWLSTEQQQHLDKILILEKIAMPYNSFLICDVPLYLSGLFSQIQSSAL